MTKLSSTRIARDIVLIAVFSAGLGLAWNHRLLLDVYGGKAVQTETAPAMSGDGTTVPLPFGLMQVKELYDRKEAVIVDARDAASFAKGRIKGALSLPLGEAEALLAGFVAKVPKSALLIIYCNGFDCHDSKNLGVLLLKAGYGQVFVFEGGYPEWKDAGYPVEGTKP